MAVIFDIGKPEIKRRIERRFEELLSRTLEDLEALHYLIRSDGLVQCMDLNLVADSEAALDSLVANFIHSKSSVDVLPAATHEDWLRMIDADLVGFRKLSGMPVRAWFVVATCRELK